MGTRQGWHEVAAEATLGNLRAKGCPVEDVEAAALVGLARAWDRVEAAGGPISAVANLARETRVLVEHLDVAPADITPPEVDLWAQLERDLYKP